MLLKIFLLIKFVVSVQYFDSNRSVFTGFADRRFTMLCSFMSSSRSNGREVFWNRKKGNFIAIRTKQLHFRSGSWAKRLCTSTKTRNGKEKAKSTSFTITLSWVQSKSIRHLIPEDEKVTIGQSWLVHNQWREGRDGMVDSHSFIKRSLTKGFSCYARTKKFLAHRKECAWKFVGIVCGVSYPL